MGQYAIWLESRLKANDRPSDGTGLLKDNNSSDNTSREACIKYILRRSFLLTPRSTFSLQVEQLFTPPFHSPQH